MSEDRLSQILTEVLVPYLQPLVKWLYFTAGVVIVATATAVTMWHDLKSDIKDAQRIAIEARAAHEALSVVVSRQAIDIATVKGRRFYSEEGGE